MSGWFHEVRLSRTPFWCSAGCALREAGDTVAQRLVGEDVCDTREAGGIVAKSLTGYRSMDNHVPGRTIGRVR